jgi:malonate transporter and related proteins
LLFRTMSGVRVEHVDLLPIAVYFPVALAMFALQVAWFGFKAEGIVKALGGTFANMVMIGITLVELAYGKAGLVTLLTLVSVHALILLTVATIVLELAATKQPAEGGVRGGAPATRLLSAVGRALKGSVLHPIPLPIMAGLLFAQTGWVMPAQVDRPLALLGQAFGPISLVLVGVTLAGQNLRSNWRPVLAVVLFKNLWLPLAVAAVAWWAGVRGLTYTVMVVAAGLPVGANAFIFAQRYRVAQDVTTSAMGLSTLLALVTLSAIMLMLG